MDKQALRRARWQALRQAGAARFPGAAGRIPNFTGAERAAGILAELPAWRQARVLKCNPDLPQRPVRHRALKEGKRLYLAVPKLATDEPFLLLDPDTLDPRALWKASSIQGAFQLARPVPLADVDSIDLIVSGAVAVAQDGARLGQGGGFADLEYALLRESGAVSARTPVVTTVHRTQVVRRGTIPMESHDVGIDGYATDKRFVPTPDRPRRPRGVLWDALTDGRREAIPLLRVARRPRRKKA